MNFLIFKPIYKERIWGGQNLKYFLKRNIQSKIKIGESWDIVDRPDEVSVVSRGIFYGQTLRQVIEQNHKTLLGPKWKINKRFPILVKWLDCEKTLSLQVHPPKPIALFLGEESKTENWYIVKSKPKSHIFLGLKKGISKQQFINTLIKQSNKLKSLLHSFYIKEGDSVFVPSGRLHAIGSGSIILEIQENSDTTYRVYDWDRIDENKNKRKLDIEKSLMSINFEDFEPEKYNFNNKINTYKNFEILSNSKEFQLLKKTFYKGDKININAFEEVRILSIVSGSIDIIYNNNKFIDILYKGDNVILPYISYFDIIAKENNTTILITEKFIQ